MPSLEIFLKKRARTTTEKAGSLKQQNLTPDDLVATRPFLTEERLKGKKRRNKKENPQVINHNGIHYIIDGHHKVRRASDSGQEAITCQVLTTGLGIIGQLLARINHGKIKDLPIRRYY